MTSDEGLEPAGSHPAGTPPAGETSTAGSSPSSPAPSPTLSPRETRAAPGVSRVKRAKRARERSSLCGVRGRAPPATALPTLSLVHTYEVTRQDRRWSARSPT
jgi:hypothetical protein